MAMSRTLSKRVVAAALLSAALAQTGGKQVIEVLHQVTVEEPAPVNFHPVPIRRDGSASIPPPIARPQPDYPMAFGAPEQNSRLPGTLPSGAWFIRWQADLNSSLPPNHVVQAADRVLTEGGGLWQLFNVSGSPVAQGRYNASHVVLDAAHSLFYFIDKDNFLTALHLNDAKKLFMTSPSFGDNFVRPLIARRDNRFVLAGVEMEGTPHRPNPANLSVIEYDDLAPELKTDETGLLFSLIATGKLLVKTNKLSAAMHGDSVVFAVPNCVYVSTSDMRPKSAFYGDFDPVTLSLDEAGRIYLVVARHGQRSLIILSPDGAEIGEYSFKPDMEELIAPPIVAYDHHVFLVSASRAVALDPAGKQVWETAISARASGAAVTADGHLLVSAGPEVSAFDGQGHRSTVHVFPGESLTSPPIITAKQDLLVTSRSHLYCLRATAR
jgi:hypothetical protein